MKKIKTLFGNYITEMELCDFTVGDRVKYILQNTMICLWKK